MFYWFGLLAWFFWLIVLVICIVCVRFVVCVGRCCLFCAGCLLVTVAGLICWFVFGGLAWFWDVVLLLIYYFGFPVGVVVCDWCCFA